MNLRRRSMALLLPALLAMAAGAAAAPREPARGQVIEVAPSERPAPRVERDRSGRQRQGQAMVVQVPGAEGPGVSIALSGVFPPGTTARVQNLQNGRTTIVQMRDGGAASRGRLIDITPPVARALGVSGSSAQVSVAPLAVPQADGTIRLGEGTRLSGTIAAPAVSDRPED